MFGQIPLLLKRLVTTRHHAGSGSNNSIPRLMRQGLPYYLNRRGGAYWPMTLFVSINGRCNLKCRMCDVGQGKTDSMFYKNLAGDGETALDFPIERFRTLVDEVRGFKPYIGITTTEPMLYQPMFEAVEYARSQGLEMNITSNGTLVEKRAEEIVDSGLHRLSVSLDGPPDLHDEMRGVPGTYERAVRGLRAVYELREKRGLKRPELLVNSFICDANHHRLLEFIEGLPLDILDLVNVKLMVFATKELMARHNARFGDKYPSTEACVPDDFAVDKLDVGVLSEQAREVKARYGDKVALHFDVERERLERYFYQPTEFMDATKCVLPWFVAQILTNGQLVVLTRCYNLDLGNIMDKPFAEVWNGPKMRAFRKDLQKYGRFPGCARCDGVLYR